MTSLHPSYLINLEVSEVATYEDDNSRELTKPNLAEEIKIYLMSCDEDNTIVRFE